MDTNRHETSGQRSEVTGQTFVFIRVNSWLKYCLLLSTLAFLLVAAFAATSSAQIGSRVPDGGGNTIEPFPISPPGDGNVLPGPTPISDGTPPITPQAGGSATWSATPTNSNWIPTGSETNWGVTAGNFPGATSGLTNADTATFLTSNTTAITINSGTLNIKSITFGVSGSEPSTFTIGSIGGNSLLLTSTGTISIPSGTNVGSGHIETVNAPLVLEPASATTAGTYTFSNGAASANLTLKFGGDIAGGTTTQGITLNLQGANTGSNAVNGIISDGSAAGGLAIVKSGNGNWTLSGANTYSAGTSINAGTLLIGVSNVGTTSGALGPSTAAVNLGDATGTAANASLLTNGAFTFSNDITVRSGNAGTATIGGNTASNSTFSGAISLNKNLTVTAVNSGTVNLTKSITNASGTNTVNITGAGTSNVVLNNSGTSNQFAPTLFSINSGKLSLGSSNQIGDSTNVTLNGGTFNTAGFSEVNGGVGSRTPGMGALTLTANSTIDFGSGTSIIEFASLGAHTPITGADLLITNWTGTVNVPGGTDQLLFAGVISDFTGKFDQSDVSFNGVTGYNIFQITAGYYEVTEVPEPSTWIAGGLALGAVLLSQRRRFARALARS